MKPADPPAPEPEEVMTLRDLEQVRILADALRVRILEAFGVEPRTTKQVAQALGEKPTKLYHHVDALERLGLIRLVRTRQNRGTLEKYYQPVARRFRVDPSILPGGLEESRSQVSEMLGSVLDSTRAELADTLTIDAERVREAVVMRMHVKASEESMAIVRGRLEKLLEGLDDDDGEVVTYGLTVAFYPLLPS